jgi:hypothetical protein
VTVTAATYRARQSEAVIVVRMLPPAEVSPNWHGSWRKKAEAVAELREQAHWATICGVDDPVNAIHLRRLERCAAVMIDFEIAWCCGRKRLDDDNAKACMKPIIDGIAQELWGGQDRHVTIGEVTQVRGAGTVTVTIRGEG